MSRPKAFNVVTYNIHKGLSQFNKRLVLHEIRDRLKSLDADVAFLQEVQGKHEANSRRHVTWPEIGQHDFLTREGCHNVYGMNAVYQDGHHGNAVVSRHPIPAWENIDVSHHPMESRGLLHCEVQIEGWKEPLHCINVHLGLWARSRRFQRREVFGAGAQQADSIAVNKIAHSLTMVEVNAAWSEMRAQAWP